MNIQGNELYAVLHSLNEAIVIIDETGMIKFFNRSAESIFGYLAHDILGENIKVIMPGDIAAKHDDYLNTYIKTGVARIMGLEGREFEAVRRNGSLLPIELCVNEIFLDGQRHFIGSIRDITLRKQLIKDYEKTSNRLESAQRIASLGNWEWNIKTGDLWWSNEIYSIFGISRGKFEATYDGFLKAVYPEDRDKVVAAVNDSVETKSKYAIQHRVLRPNGEVRLVQETGEITVDENNEPAFMLGTVQDITERTDLEMQLQQSQKLEVVGQLTGGISHDL